MANGFKTTFVGAPTSFSELGARAGAQAGAAIQQAFAASAQEKDRKQKEAEMKYGFDKAGMEIIPSGIEPRFQEGLQSYLNEYESKAAIAKQNPTSENIADYQRARQDYLDFKQVSVTQSNFNRQTAVNIQTGKIPGLLGTREENMSLYNKYRSGDGITSMFKDGQLVVVEDGVEKNWRESTAFSASSVFVPMIEAPESKYSVSKTQLELGARVFAPNAATLQVRTKDGFAVGEIDKAAARNLGVEYLNSRGVTDAEQNTAIAYNAYNQIQKSGVGITEQDFDKALLTYDPSINEATVRVDEKEMGVATITGIDENGKAVFSTTDDDIKAAGLSEQEENRIFNWRKAKAMFYESSVNNQVNQIKVVDESARQTALNETRRANRLKNDINAANDAAEVQQKLLKEYSDSPALSVITPATETSKAVYGLPLNFTTFDDKSSEKITVISANLAASSDPSMGSSPQGYKAKVETQRVDAAGNPMFKTEYTPTGARVDKPVMVESIVTIDPSDPRFDYITTATINKLGDVLDKALLKIDLNTGGFLSDSQLGRRGIPLNALLQQPLQQEPQPQAGPAQGAPAVPKFDEQMTNYLLREDINERQKELFLRQVESGNFNVTFDSNGKPVFTRK
tara:strand:+ start:773 stop:2650 length:1878 start_codon:yes stop_codon:yes gene_type:complete